MFLEFFFWSKTIWSISIFFKVQNHCTLMHSVVPGPCPCSWECSCPCPCMFPCPCLRPYLWYCLRPCLYVCAACSLIVFVQDGYAAWTYRKDMDMQHGHWHAVCTWTCSVDMDMQHRHISAAWTRTWEPYEAEGWKITTNGGALQTLPKLHIFILQL